MLQFISLGSGSSGNCYYFRYGEHGLLIDLGIGIRPFKRHFSNYGLKLSQIDAALVTHDHTDHVKAIGYLSQLYNIPIYATTKVHESMLVNHYLSKKVPPKNRVNIRPGETFAVGPFHVQTATVPHDSAENCAYKIEIGQRTVVIMTDIGHFTDDLAQFVSEADYLIIESNYDEQLLAKGPYPKWLQLRITGDYGHISNHQTGQFLATHLTPSHIKHIWLCHLSAENNQPALALSTVVEALSAAGFAPNTAENGLKCEVLPRKTPTLLTTLF